MQAEVSQIRNEILRLSHQLDLIKEAYSLRKELEVIQKSVEELKNQSKNETSRSSSNVAPASNPTPVVATVSTLAPAVVAPVAVKQPAPVATTPSPVVTENSSLPSNMYSKEESDAILGAKNKEAQKPEFQNFGMDADLARKNAEKHDPQLENEAREWIQNVTGDNLQGSLASSLKSGVVLCNLVNKIKPNSIKKINKMSAPFMQMENINNFLSAIQQLGVPQSDSFMTVDLYEEKNVNQVITTINSLGRLSRNVPGYTGPSIGPKLATKHEVHFTEEQLRRGQNSLNFAQESQKESGKMSAEMIKSGTDSVIRTKETGTTTTSLSLMDAGKADAQKEANTARREGHNIIR